MATVSLESVVTVRDGLMTASLSLYDEGNGSAADPIEVFCPLKSGVGSPQDSLYPQGAQLPTVLVASGGPLAAFTNDPQLSFGLSHNVDTDDIIVIAAEDSSATDYKVLTLTSGAKTFNLPNGILASVALYLEDLDSVGTPFSSYYTGTENASLSKKIFIFSAPALQNLDDFDPADHSGGIHLELHFSSKVPSSTVSITNLRIGDTELIVDYTVDTAVDDYYKLLIFNYTAAAVAPLTLAAANGLGAVWGSPLENTQIGTIDIKNLVNLTTYNFGLALLNKYQFATTVSASRPGRPLEIEAFIKESACYFFSAGFGEEHYVLQYLRSFRDRILLTNYFGSKLVDFYYATAPEYVRYIYSSQTISAIVRGIAYFLYFLLNYCWYLLFFLTFVGVVTVMVRRKALVVRR